MAWHPLSGRALLTPSFQRPGDVSLSERLRWGRKSAKALSGVHTDTVTHSTFSANGAHLPDASVHEAVDDLILLHSSATQAGGLVQLTGWRQSTFCTGAGAHCSQAP